MSFFFRTDWALRGFLIPLWAGVLAVAASGQDPSEARDAVPGLAETATPELVPAAFGIWTDRGGNSWSVEAAGNIGRIGSAMVNSGLALSLNDEKFVPYQPMMTPDGKEMVLQSLPVESFPGLRVQRRIRLLDDPGGLRYAELLHNDSVDRITVTVELANNFSGNFRTFLSDRGRSEPLLLSEGETGVFVLPGTSHSSRAFLFTLAEAGAEVRPSLSSQNRYALTFRYRIDLRPGESAALVHHVAQVAIPQSFDRRTLLRASRPFALDRIRDSFDPDWSNAVVNAAIVGENSLRELFERGGIAELGISPSPRDVLAIGAETRLEGKAEGEGILFSGPYGDAEFALEAVAALSGKGARGERLPRVYLRDGQVLSGGFSGSGLSFTPAGGSRIDLRESAFDHVAMAGSGLVPSWPDGIIAIVETQEGDRIAVPEGGGFSMGFATPWGRLEFSEGGLLRLGAAAGTPGLRVEFKDGNRFRGVPLGEPLLLEGTVFGRVEIPAARLRRIYTREGMGTTATRDLSSQAILNLFGDQSIAGSIAESSFDVSVDGALLGLSTEELRRIVRLESSGTATESRWEGARFQMERWDGGIVVGVPRIDGFSVEVRGTLWRIPLRDIVSIDFAAPAPTTEDAERIEALVGDLASSDWIVRENATRELGAFGYLARSLLRRKLREATDPEVVRRLETILSKLN